MQIGRWAREREVFAHVPENSICYSSCALVYVGATTRNSQGEVGLHRPYLAGAPLSETNVKIAVSEMHQRIREYIEEMGITTEFANIMMNTPPSEVHVFRGQEIYAIVPEADAMYDEVRAARNARIYGISTDEYRRRDLEADQQCDINSFIGIQSDAPPLMLYDRCRQAVYWGLSQSVYQRRAETTEATCGFLKPLDVSDLTLLSDAQRTEITQLMENFRSCQIATMEGRSWP